MARQYQVLTPTAPVPAPDDVLEQVVREGAQRILAEALEREVEEFLGRSRYERSAEFRGYRNGSHKPRTIGVGMGAVEVKVPRVREVPEAVSADGYHSQIVESYERRSRTQSRLLVRLYLEGLSSGDFEPVFRALVGETAGLSEDSILKLRGEWAQEFEAWQQRSITGRFAYIFADGIYLKAGLEKDKTAVLVVIGVDEQGHKQLLAMVEGHRESSQSWLEVLRSMRDRGLQQAPLLAVADGGLGFWAALDQVYPRTRHQKCWNHRILNVIDKLPKRMEKEARARLREIYEAPSREESTRLREAYCRQLRVVGQDQAARCLESDWESMTAYFDFPQEHWRHLKTSNPIESVFAGVRGRTQVTRRMRVRENALYLVFKMVCRLSLNWRRLDGPNQIKLLLAGHRYENGQLCVPSPAASPATPAAGPAEEVA